jgi:O-antigen ligase
VRQLVYVLIFLYIANNVDSPRLLRGIRFACLTGLLLESIVIIVAFQLGSYANVFEKLYRVPKVEITALADTYQHETKPGEKLIVRSRGTFGHPSSAALYLELMLPLALTLWLARSRWQERIQYLALSIVGWGALLMTFSRAALVGAAFGLACTVWITRQRRLCSQGEYRAFITAVALLALALAPSIQHYLTLRPQAFAFRFPLMREAVDMWWASPIVGVGLNNSSASNPNFRLKERGDGGEALVVVHNQYLTIAIDTGIVGLALYLAIFVVLGAKAWRASRSRDPDIACFAIGILCSWLGIAVHVNADPFAGNTLLAMTWMYAGLIVALERMERERNQPADQAPRRLSPSSPSSPAMGARSARRAEQLGGESSARP